MKKVLNLKDTKLLNKTEQKMINGSKGKGEVCSDDFPLLICYAPATCHVSNGSYYCA